jgi:hypothetical protein
VTQNGTATSLAAAQQGNIVSTNAIGLQTRTGECVRKESDAAVNSGAEKGPVASRTPILEGQPSKAPTENKES